jgi:hypothetical protein
MTREILAGTSGCRCVGGQRRPNYPPWVRVIPHPAPRRERGELGQGRVRAARSAAWMPLIETGRSPGTINAPT